MSSRKISGFGNNYNLLSYGVNSGEYGKSLHIYFFGSISQCSSILITTGNIQSSCCHICGILLALIPLSSPLANHLTQPRHTIHPSSYCSPFLPLILFLRIEYFTYMFSNAPSLPPESIHNLSEPTPIIQPPHVSFKCSAKNLNILAAPNGA